MLKKVLMICNFFGPDTGSCSIGFRNVFASVMPFMFLSRSGMVATTAIERVLVLMQELTWFKSAVCFLRCRGSAQSCGIGLLAGKREAACLSL